MNYDSKFLESQFLNDEINEELQDLNEGVLGNVVKNIVRSIKNKFSKANGKETHYRETIKKDKEKEHKSQAPKFKEPPKEVQDGRDAFVKEVFSKTSPLIKRIVSRYPLLKGCIGAIEYDTNSIDNFVYWGEYDLAVAYYDIWEHEDVKADKVRARALARNTYDTEKPSVWTDEFVDQFNHAVEDIEKEVTKLSYGECELDCDWDDGQFTLYIPDKTVKEYVDKYLKDHPISEEYTQNEELVDFLEQVVQEATLSDIGKENKKIIEKIAKEVFSKASKLVDDIAKKNGLKYLVDKKYELLNNNYNYELSDNEDEQYEFGMFQLFGVSTSKVASMNKDPKYGEPDWNKWEDAVFELIREVNKLPEVSKYGKATSEQPDDGDQVWFFINKDLLKTTIQESLQNEPVNADIKRNMQEVEDTERYNNPTHGEDNLANGDEDVLAVMDKVTTNVHGTLFGAGTDDSLVYAGAYDSYMADILDNERCLAKALRMECGLNESSYSILNEARIQDTIKEKWEKFVNFINRIDDRFYSAMEKILLQQKDYLEKYEDIINNKKPREDLEYEYEGDYIEGIDRCMNTPVPIFNYERDAKWLRQEGYEGAIKDFMAGKNFKYNKDEELAQQFKNWFIAAERGTTKGKFSNLNFKAMYQFCYKYQDIEAMVKKDQTALDQSTNILINAVNKALRERGESTTQDQTAKSDTNTTTAGASAKNNASAANNGGNTAATPNTTTSTTESYWMPLDEADNNANNNGNNNKPSGLTIKTNTPNKADANGNVKQKDVTAAGDYNTTSQDMNNILNKWIAMCKALITAKLTCTQKIARDYMKLIKAHVRSYGGKGNVDNKNGENTTEKSNAEVSQNQQEENKTEQK